MNERGFRILAALDEIAAAHKVAPAAIALAWLMQRNSVTAPIASATSVEQLQQLAVSAQINLSDEQVAELDVASAD
jgi:aryl-alcohol dehydrogenase-like predicted oxidoreductase